MLISINNASMAVLGFYLINFQTITDWHQFSSTNAACKCAHVIYHGKT